MSWLAPSRFKLIFRTPLDFSTDALALLRPAWRTVWSTLLSIKHGRYREEELPPIWQLGGGLVDPLTQRDEGVVELVVVERS